MLARAIVQKIQLRFSDIPLPETGIRQPLFLYSKHPQELWGMKQVASSLVVSLLCLMVTASACNSKSDQGAAGGGSPGAGGPSGPGGPA